MASPLGSTPGIIVGVGVGTAVSAAIEPALEVSKQEAWKRLPNRINHAELVARLVAQGGIALGARDGSDPGTAYEAARRDGYRADKLDQLIYLTQTTPDVAAALHLWRRDLISDELWTHVLRKHGLDARYFPALNRIKQDILSPGELAAAIHRGLVPDPGLLKGEQPQEPFTVDAYPVYPIRTLDEAAGSGYDRDRLGVLVGLQGLPMGTHEAAQAFYRGIITHGDYVRAFNESNSRNEWAEAVLEYTRQIPTARDFFENALRGYHDLAWAQEQAQRHGMTPADSLVIYQNQGRPMNLRAITQALARGGEFQPEEGEITDPYMASIVEGNLKPAYYNLAYANRYTLPTAFAIRGLAEAGVWEQPKVALRLKQSGWLPEDAEEVATAWTAPAKATTNPYIGRAQTQLWTAVFQDYVRERTINRSQADALLIPLVPQVRARTQILDLWTTARDLPAPAAAVHENPWIAKANQQLWTAIHKSYVKDESIDETTADSYLTNLVSNATVRAVVLERWTTERNLGSARAAPA